MRTLLLLPLLLGFSAPAFAHNDANGGLVPLPGMPGMPGMGGTPKKSCPKQPPFNSSPYAKGGSITDYKGRKCDSVTCITVRNGDNWKGVWSCSGRPE